MPEPAPEVEPIAEEVLELEEIVEEPELEDAEPICSNQRVWTEAAQDTFTHIPPYEELYARKVYEMSDWGVGFEIPGEYSDTHVFKDEWIDALFSPNIDPGCVRVGDLMEPYITEVEATSRFEDYEYLGLVEFKNISADEFAATGVGGRPFTLYQFEFSGAIFHAAALPEDKALLDGILDTFEAL